MYDHKSQLPVNLMSERLLTAVHALLDEASKLAAEDLQTREDLARSGAKPGTFTVRPGHLASLFFLALARFFSRSVDQFLTQRLL